MENTDSHENLASEENYDYAEEDEETLPPSSNLCCCLQGVLQSKWRRWRRRRGDNASRRHLLQQQQGDQIVAEDESWVVKSVKKAKEVSEVWAGPKWKNFIRRLSKCGIVNNKKKRLQFHYDPQSYALNFNDGIDKEADGAAYLEFSGRYADPLGMNKGQVGLD